MGNSDNIFYRTSQLDSTSYSRLRGDVPSILTSNTQHSITWDLAPTQRQQADPIHRRGRTLLFTYWAHIRVPTNSRYITLRLEEWLESRGLLQGVTPFSSNDQDVHVTTTRTLMQTPLTFERVSSEMLAKACRVSCRKRRMLR